jgi:hypothetical protein
MPPPPPLAVIVVMPAPDTLDAPPALPLVAATACAAPPAPTVRVRVTPAASCTMDSA